MIYILIIGIFLGFEIQKLFQFNFFFRLKCITSDYYNNIILRKLSLIQKEVVKVGLVDFVYYIVIFTGFFTINKYFFFAISIQSFIISIIFRTFKNKKIRKFFCISDSIMSIVILCLILINLLYFKIDSVQFIKMLIPNF